MTVAPEFRRLGLARELMRSLESVSEDVSCLYSIYAGRSITPSLLICLYVRRIQLLLRCMKGLGIQYIEECLGIILEMRKTRWI